MRHGCPQSLFSNLCMCEGDGVNSIEQPIIIQGIIEVISVILVVISSDIINKWLTCRVSLCSLFFSAHKLMQGTGDTITELI